MIVAVGPAEWRSIQLMLLESQFCPQMWWLNLEAKLAPSHVDSFFFFFFTEVLMLKCLKEVPNMCIRSGITISVD